jgi:hypothetical protein
MNWTAFSLCDYGTVPVFTTEHTGELLPICHSPGALLCEAARLDQKRSGSGMQNFSRVSFSKPVLRILIFIHPGSRIPDPQPQQHKKRRGKFFVCPTIFISHKYHKILNNFLFEQVKNFFSQNTKNFSYFLPRN